MKTISLSKGYTALVDDKDYLRVSAFTWHCVEVKRSDGSVRQVYARRSLDKYNSQLLHRFIMEIDDPKINVDHQDHDGLNCQRYNLRVATDTQNQGNRRKQKGASSKYKGVYQSTKDKVWIATLGLDSTSKSIHLGCFTSELEAARAYDDAAKEYFGEFASTNFHDGVKSTDKTRVTKYGPRGPYRKRREHL